MVSEQLQLSCRLGIPLRGDGWEAQTRLRVIASDRDQSDGRANTPLLQISLEQAR